MTGNRSAKTQKRTKQRGGARLLGPFGVFLRGAIQHPQMVGAVFPSSKATIDNMLKRVDWDDCKLVIEYGPGVGTFCSHILERLPADAQLIAIDLNQTFVEHLNRTITDPRFRAVLGSATDVEQIVRDSQHEVADVVISGMPISTLPPGVAEEMVEATYRVLKPGGAFLTYQYRLKARRLTEQAFDRIEKDFVLRNVPPNYLTWGWKAA